MNQQDVFNRIAAGWYGFRHRSIFSRELAELAAEWQGGRLLNVGCGHGPDFVPFKNGFELHGIDFSDEMLRLARKYAAKHSFEVELALADMRRLPYADGAFDYAIAVASYHHIKGHEEQRAALGELQRVLKPGGRAFITAWNRWQPRFWFKPREAMMPWRQKGEVLYRYYHLFSYAELEVVVKQAGFRVIKSFPESSYRWPVKMFSRNICLLVERVD